MEPHDLDGQRAAYRPEFPFYAENERVLSWYADRLVDCARRRRAGSALSLGVGQRIVGRQLLGLLRRGELREYVVVDGSEEAIREFELVASEADHPAGAVSAFRSYFETFETERRFDVIEMGFVLEHVDDPGLVLKRFVRFLEPEGVLVIAVPNARSLHRLIGHEAGLLDDIYVLSEADRQLGHQRYFDLAGLRRLVAEADLVVEREEGIYLKPLTTGQLDSLELPDNVLRALCRVGADFPDISNALYVECRFRPLGDGD